MMHIGKKTDADQEFGDMSSDFNAKSTDSLPVSAFLKLIPIRPGSSPGDIHV